MSTRLLFILLLSCSWGAARAQVTQDHLAYVERFSDIAVREMERAGVPASIKLAQGILESGAGTSQLARRANNHFGIKCGPDWRGDTYMQEDDDYDAQGQLIKSCFRVFRTAEASYVAHSEFLRDPSKQFRYGFLFRLDPTDYRSWAEGLRQAGYATSGTYAQRLIELIERYELYKYDRMSTIDIDTPSEIVATGILTNNDVNYVVATGNETVADIARRTDVAVKNLISYNENIESAEQRLTEGDRIYLQPKRNAYRGRQNFHVVNAGDNMFSISQQYGVKLSKLYRRNRLEPGQEPHANEQIKLRGGRVKTAPRLRREGEEEVLPTLPTLPEVGGEIDFDDSGVIEVDRPTTPPPPTTTAPTNPPPPRPDVPVIIIGGGQPAPSPAPTSPTTPPTTPPVREDPFGTPPATTTTPPPASTGQNPPPATTTPPPATQAQYHTVQQGDTLWNISQRYGLKVDDLKRLNNLSSDNIQLGMRLRVR